MKGELPQRVGAATAVTEELDSAAEDSIGGQVRQLLPAADDFELRQMEARLFSGAFEAVRVDRFRLEERLGSGGMGTVWRAYDEQLARSVALKFLRRRHASEVGELRLLEEAQALAQLAHPNVVSVFDAGRHEGRVWIAMEHVPGQTLRAWSESASTDERLAAWIAAGEGLAAVHRAGLVHRDVKPDNVLIGGDGRVRLIDFGLVRAYSPTPSTLPSERLAPGGESERRSEVPPTEAGAFLGTPNYAAPEQKAGEQVDARADQYAYAVSLWESLTGERPSETPAQDASASKMSRRVRAALERALSNEASARFESMDALLEALRPRRRRWAAPLGASAALAGLLGLALRPEATPCEGDPQALIGRWQAQERTKLRAALATHAAPWADAALDRLDAWSAAWGETQRNACLDTREHARYSEAVLDMRSSCLDDLGREFWSSVDLLGTGTVHNARDVAQLLDGLPQTSICDNVSSLELGPKPPAAPARVESLRDELAKVRVSFRAGVQTEIDQPMVALVGRAEALGYAPLRAEALALRGRMNYELGRRDAGVADLRAAIDLAEGSRHDRVAARSWVYLARLEARYGKDAEARVVDLPRARASIERLDDPRDALWVDFALARAAKFAHEENWAALIEELDTALERASTTLPALHSSFIDLHHRRANALGDAGRPEEALASFDAARDALDSRWGLDNLWFARILQDRGSTELEALGDVSAGRRHLRQALELYTAHGADEGPDLAWLNVALGMAAYLEADYEAAETAVARGLQILEASLGPDNSDALAIRGNLGAVRHRLGDYEGARAAYTVALERQTRLLGASHPEVGALEANIGEAYLAQGRDADAIGHLQRGVTILEGALGPKHPDLAPVLKSLGIHALHVGRLHGAQDYLERSLALLESHPDADPAELAEVCWALARVRDRRGDRARALALARRATQTWDDIGDSQAGADARAWLAAN